MNFEDRVGVKIADKIARNQLRILEKKSDFDIDFSSNDYLCLAKNEKVINSACDFAKKYGTGGGSSRVLSSIDAYFELEELIAKCKNKEKALLFSSGFMANHACLSAILSLYSENEIDIFSDKLNHASIHSGIGNRHQIRYNNIDLNHLELRLKQSTKKHKIVITEGVFSMDGTILDIDNLIALKRKYGFMIYIDEAHSIGVFGENGYGLSTKYAGEIEFSMGTLSKAIGSQGGYIAVNSKISDYLLNFCQGFVYSTAINPPAIGSAICAIKLLPSLENERLKLFENRNYLSGFFEKDVITQSKSQIFPILMPSEIDAINCQKSLMEAGIFAPSIRPPTVQTSRIRVSLNVSHSKEDIDKLVKILRLYAA
ncbi:aminotransferase class I/II-fold pyridoxal phosphate-dependent enzyme [Candidatus Deianiraea vastatrix]|uniref:5-aminolevulinate synthase n=1 Tax=Candidatus Deianiraea vastatrix TaxID=2163644 RepID=A0A5B8XCY9_9RICK|nr:pyridoxal phosphate-dependent aminotransferase family protein [Candidatus Deianiraea vastatrix]QED23173.1 8-amino-7-oxononanoate synthase [Candidatus Deianiraea vastatrix]